MQNPPIYLDHAMTTPLSSHLINQMQPYFKRHWQCLSAPYLTGKEPFATINQKIETMYRVLGARKTDRFVFTSCGAEAIAHVFYGLYLDAMQDSGKTHIITTPVEDASILVGIERLKKLGVRGREIPLNQEGVLTKEALEASLSPRTALLSLSWAHPLTGVIQPIEELGKVCREKGILFHVDVSDVLGKLYFRFEDLPVDFLTFDGDRFHAPKGSGGLLIRAPHDLGPLIPDGMQQQGKRGGTLNLPALIGLGIAFEELNEHFDYMTMEVARLRSQLEQGILSGVPGSKALFHQAPRLPHVTTIIFPGIFHELLAFHLAQQGVFVSFGGGRNQKLEHLLIKVGITQLEAQCALSFSLSRDTTEEEIIRAIGMITDAAHVCLKSSIKESDLCNL